MNIKNKASVATKVIGAGFICLLSAAAVGDADTADDDIFGLNCRLRVPFASIHMPDADDDNGFNPGIGITCAHANNGFYGTTGVFYNSERRTAVFLGGGYERKIWQREDLFLKLGLELLLVTGYEKTPVLGAPVVTLGKARHSLQAFVLPVSDGAIGFSYHYDC